MKEKKHIAVMWNVPPGTTDERIEFFAGQARKTALIIENYWRYFAGHKWDVRVEGYSFVGECNIHPPSFCYSEAMDYLEDNLDFDPNYIHVIGSNADRYCGQGERPGSKSVNYTYHVCGARTSVHEIGHNFGLHHTGTRDESGREREYGDWTTIMGSNSTMQGLCSPHMVYLGLETEREVHTVDATEQILLAPIELSERPLHAGEYQHAIIQTPRAMPYYLSIRKGRGTRYPLDQEDKLYVYEWSARDGRAKRLIPDLLPGGTLTLDSGVLIKYEEYKKETARVSVIFPGDGLPDDIPMPSGPPPSLKTSTVLNEHTGSWYDRKYDGQGLDVHIKDGRGLVYWYTYGDQGTRRYYWGTGPIKDGACEFDLFTSKDGRFDNPTEHQAYKVGVAQLFFLGENNGRFNFITGEHGRGSMELTPVVRGGGSTEKGISGSWYDKDNPGDGLSIQEFPQIGRTVVYWYTYGPKYRPGLPGGRRPKGVDTQRWFVAVGDAGEELDVYEYIGGRWMFFDLPEEVPVGSATVRWDEETDKLTFDYLIDAKDVSGDGRLFLDRLF